MLFNTVIDLLVQPGGPRTRRRAELVVPSEYYSAHDVFAKIRKVEPPIELTHKSGAFTILSDGTLMIDNDPVSRSRIRTRERTGVGLREIKKAAIFWKDEKNIEKLFTLLEPDFHETTVLTVPMLGVEKAMLEAAVAKVWGQPLTEAVKVPLWLPLTGKYFMIPGKFLGLELVNLTEEGWLVAQEVRESKRLREEAFRKEAVASIEGLVARVEQQRKQIVKRYEDRISATDSQLKELREELDRLRSVEANCKR